MTSPSKILVAGYYGAKNAGDEAILVGLLASFGAAGHTGDFTVLSHDPADTQALHGVGAAAWNDIEALIDAAKQADLIVVGGGGLFHDYWGVDPATVLTGRHGGIAQYATPVYLAAMLGKPCALLGVGVGPLHSQEARDLTRAVFEMADLAFVRDRHSLDLLRDIGVNAGRVQIGADLAFAAPPVAIRTEAESFLLSLPHPVMGVALRHWTFGEAGDAWQGEVTAAIDGWQEATGGTPLFITMQTGGSEIEDDVAVARLVMENLRRPEVAALLPGELNPLERFWAVGLCDLVLGMRMHSLVAAQRCGVPSVGLAYDPKVTALLPEGEAAGRSLPLQIDRESLVQSLLALPRGQPGADDRGLKIALSQAKQALRRSSSRGDDRRSAASLDALGDVLVRLGRMDDRIRQLSIELATVVQASAHQAERSHAVEERLNADLATAREEASGLRSSVVHLSEKLVSVRQTVAGLERQVGLLQATSADLEKEVGQLQATSADLSGELESLRTTIGVSLLARYWAVAHRLAPAGSRRRRWYWQMRNGLTSIARKPAWRRHPLPQAAHLRADALEGLVEFLASHPRAVEPFVVISPTLLRLSEGQRATHLALDLARRGHAVIFAYWRWSPKDVGDPSPENVFQIPLDMIEADPRSFVHCFGAAEPVQLIEFPYPGLFELLAFARGRGWTIGYDVVDHWAEFHRVGQADWYDPDFEAHLAVTANVVVAVNGRLAQRLKALGAGDVVIIPNGVRPGIERRRRAVTLPRGDITLGYFGYLSDAWFDWDLVEQVARREPSWRIHLIGYGANGRRPPANVSLVGKVDSAELASHAALWDVGIVPFKPSPLSADADPIKTYEYLAMGLPVVMTGAEPPAGAESLVRRADDVDSFIAQVRLAVGEISLAGARQEFASQSTWLLRTSALLAAFRAAGVPIRTPDVVG